MADWLAILHVNSTQPQPGTLSLTTVLNMQPHVYVGIFDKCSMVILEVDKKSIHVPVHEFSVEPFLRIRARSQQYNMLM